MAFLIRRKNPFMAVGASGEKDNTVLESVSSSRARNMAKEIDEWDEDEINAPLTEDELKEFENSFTDKELEKMGFTKVTDPNLIDQGINWSKDNFKESTGAITPMSILDLVPTKAGSILGTKMLRFFNKSLGKTREFFRGLGKGGFDDAIESGVFRPKQTTDVKKNKFGDNKFNIERTGSFNKDPITGQSRDTYVSGAGNIETGKSYTSEQMLIPNTDFMRPKHASVGGAYSEIYPKYLAQFDDLDKVLSKQGRKLKYKKKKNVHYFTDDLPVDQSNAKIIKFTGPDDKFGTTVADFRKPLIGKLPTPTTPITNESKNEGYKPKRKFSFLKKKGSR
jgi:hypothetical protein